MTLEVVVDWLLQRGGGMYGGEAVTQLDHALQCATLARADGASPALVMAALLHDIGHLADCNDDMRHPHGLLGAQLLARLFGPDVTEPIRMHADAKRYLCAHDPVYWSGLSPASRRSLAWQGGIFSVPQAAAFIAQPYAKDAVRLRLWDDAARVPRMPTLSIDTFIISMKQAALSNAGMTAL